MTGRRRRTGRVRLTGWWKSVPFLVLPFSVLFYETWLETQTRQNDYRANELTERLRECRERIDALKAEWAAEVRMDRIAEEAPSLGLVEPEPNQVVIVEVDDLDERHETNEETNAPPEAARVAHALE